jgi:RimJ/RimL family protein N-acetyltransferase
MGPTLYTARLQLREWTMEDAEEALQIYGDPEVMRFLGDGQIVPGLEEQQAWLAERIERYHSPAFDGFGVWAAVERETQQVVGTLLLKPLPPTTDEIEIGWHLNRRVWGKGYASEAATCVMRYGFEKLHLDRILAVVRPENVRSVAVARRIGMRYLERTNRYYGGEEVDVFVIERESFNESTSSSS